MNRILPLALLCLASWSCSSVFHQPMRDQLARLGEETEITKQLRKLPPPDAPLVAAVYKFRDQTGQYRPQEVGSGFSTVVTQGATNILIKALEDSGWFTPIERENVGNLLNERKIIRSSRIQYEGAQGPAIPPLLFADILLEGGIVSYDANILTGGFGARYFGAGGQGRYRQDRVTVYLRAISTNNGQILKTVYTSKTILSQAVDGGMFRYVSFRRLLEIETGYTYNEPSDLAVMEAIEKAVHSLVVEGIKAGYWNVKQGEVAQRAKLIREYDAEVAAMRETNMFGRQVFYKPTGLGVRSGANTHYYKGDLPSPDLSFGGELGLEYFLNNSLGLSFEWGAGLLSSSEAYRERISFAGLNGVWRMLPWDRFSPVMYSGVGMVLDQDGRSAENTARNYFKLQAGGGFEYFLSENLAIDLFLDYNYLLNDEIDRLASGKFNDLYYRGRVGLKYFLGKEKE